MGVAEGEEGQARPGRSEQREGRPLVTLRPAEEAQPWQGHQAPRLDQAAQGEEARAAQGPPGQGRGAALRQERQVLGYRQEADPSMNHGTLGREEISDPGYPRLTNSYYVFIQAYEYKPTRYSRLRAILPYCLCYNDPI